MHSLPGADAQVPAPTIVPPDRRAVFAAFELLSETFPHCFKLFEQKRRPLQIGIHHEILAVLTGVITPEELAAALSVYVANRVYRSRLVAGAVRVGLDGEPAGTVTPEEAKHARPRVKAAPVPVKAAPVPSQQSPTIPPPRRRLSLGDLRAAARQRRGGQCQPPTPAATANANADRPISIQCSWPSSRPPGDVSRRIPAAAWCCPSARSRPVNSPKSWPRSTVPVRKRAAEGLHRDPGPRIHGRSNEGLKNMQEMTAKLAGLPDDIRAATTALTENGFSVEPINWPDPEAEGRVKWILARLNTELSTYDFAERILAVTGRSTFIVEFGPAKAE
jgi:ProP effector